MKSFLQWMLLADGLYVSQLPWKTIRALYLQFPIEQTPRTMKKLIAGIDFHDQTTRENDTIAHVSVNQNVSMRKLFSVSIKARHWIEFWATNALQFIIVYQRFFSINTYPRDKIYIACNPFEQSMWECQYGIRRTAIYIFILIGMQSVII